MDAPPLELDAARPTPMYRQIAEALRYRIARGLLAPGARLPGLRDAARAWRVNLHTVRRAYHELQRAHLVEVRRPGGTHVALEAHRLAGGEAERFVREVLHEGRRRLDLDPQGVVELLARAAGRGRPAFVHVTECSRQLAGALAQELGDRLGLDARPCLIGDLAQVGKGPVIATWFHYADVRSRLPDRAADLLFASIEPSLAHPETVVRRALRAGGQVTLADRDPLLAPAIATDVARLLGDPRVRVVPDARTSPGALLRRRQGPVVCSPGAWERLSAADRADPDVALLEYHFTTEALTQLGRALQAPLPPGGGGAGVP